MWGRLLLIRAVAPLQPKPLSARGCIIMEINHLGVIFLQRLD
jgi:hypothetical protein